MSEFRCQSNASCSRVLRVVALRGGRVQLHIRDSANQVSETVQITAAVPLARAILDAAGVDAVVLDGLPEIAGPDARGRIELGEGPEACWAKDFDNPNWHWQHAANAAAIARYLDQHPPADPQVGHLSALLDDAHKKGRDVGEVAQYLLDHGVRVTEEAEK